MSILGAHMSTAGGFDKAIERAERAGCDCVQIFVTSPRAWPKTSPEGPGIAPEVAANFRQRLHKSKLDHPIAHGSYLINLASPDKALWQKSIDGMVAELRRADALGLEAFVVHPGAHTTTTERKGIKNVSRALNEICRQTRDLTVVCLLENTAGQGSSLGWQFEQLAAMLDGTRNPDRVGICFDTCHAFAAGYPMSSVRDYRATMKQFDDTVGTTTIQAFHLNDSKRELGSRVDRHEHIGRGELGESAFRHLLRDRRFRKTPMYLETPKGKLGRRDADRVNLELLRHS